VLGGENAAACGAAAQAGAAVDAASPETRALQQGGQARGR
jgi:hypothetical protein